MYRNYEDPYQLEKEYEAEKLRQQMKAAEGYELDDFDYERLADLKERINFAWQDQEYDEQVSDYEGFMLGYNYGG